MNFDDISEFGFYAYDQERRIPVYTHTSEGYFEKAGYTLLENGELINSLPPYLTWSCDNEALATACAGTVIWHGEGYAKIRATDPLSGTYIEFELSVYYVDTEILESETAKKANLEPGMTVAYRFTPYISGKYQINASPSDGAIFFIIADSKGLAMASGYDGVPAFFEAGKTYIIEAFNFGVDTSKTEYTFILKEETFNCNVSAGNGGAVRGGGIYSNGDLVMLQAIPADGYMFEGWYENGKKIPGATANFVLAIRTDRTLTAKFVPYEFEINRITIEGICSKGQRLTFVPEIVGGAGKHKYAFYIYKEGKMYYINKNSTGKTFSYTPTSAGTYTVMVYSIDETGNKVSFTEQFTII